MTEKSDLEKLLEIEHLLGYGEGKQSELHIKNTPRRIQLETMREELKEKIKKILDFERISIGLDVQKRLLANQRTEQDKQNEQIIEKIRKKIRDIETLEKENNVSQLGLALKDQLQSILGEKK